MTQCISVLGSTGSIGTQSLQVCKMQGYSVCGLAANRNISLLEQQTREFSPKKVCIYDQSLYSQLKIALADTSVEVFCGMEGLLELASMEEADTVLNSVVGMIGLTPTLRAIQAGKKVALANKETLVTGGKLVTRAVQQHHAALLPVDSEHSAIFQCLQGNQQNKIKKILLTASGGPFFGKTKGQLQNIRPADALKHPNWDMGAKITIDSATMMNKGLEFIEAMWLFDLEPEQIQVVVHRESVVHSAVMFEDNSVMAQLGNPDMRIPIQYALTYPDRKPSPAQELDLFAYGALHFARPDLETFDCLACCIEAIRRGGLYPTIVNGANEQAVALFLQEKIGFLQIGELVRQALDGVPAKHEFTVEDIIMTDRAAREFVRNHVCC